MQRPGQSVGRSVALHDVITATADGPRVSQQQQQLIRLAFGFTWQLAIPPLLLCLGFVFLIFVNNLLLFQVTLVETWVWWSVEVRWQLLSWLICCFTTHILNCSYNDLQGSFIGTLHCQWSIVVQSDIGLDDNDCCNPGFNSARKLAFDTSRSVTLIPPKQGHTKYTKK